ncbi:MAG: hypothetical protein IT442_15020 [Phycisphaeraceae bacterium]|nr:hypothetical protein [Phycisphaeraceae bacterium]
MANWFTKLHDAMDSRQFGPMTLNASSGRLLVARHGARILACQIDAAGQENLFWHPAAMEDPASKVLTGGDRLWIGPEIAYFWPSLEKAREDPVRWARVPTVMDPGQYTPTTSGLDQVSLRTQMTLTDVRVNKRINLQVDRLISLIGSPANLPGGVSCLSYGLTHTLSLVESSAEGVSDIGALAGAWTLLQVPSTGTLVCPVTHKAEPRCYYDPFGTVHVQSDERQTRFLIDANRRIKMGIPAEATTGRMGYYRRLTSRGGGISTLIVRVFSPLPGEPYVDMPRACDALQRIGGDCLQAYNDDGKYGEFGEMEHHDPAVIVGQGPHSRSATSVTHVLAGPDDLVRQTGKMLLGVEPTLIVAP